MIKRAELLQYAAHGVRERLHQIQKELNELARLFPGIVKHQDGTVPSVLPVELKPKRSNGLAGTKRGPYKAKTKRSKGSAAIRAYWAKMTPTARKKEFARRREVAAAKKKSQ